jgi:hypothetical protein
MEITMPPLTRREQEVFEALKGAEGPMPIGQLASQVFGFSDASALQEVRVWVSRLRAKGIPIRTILGVGYMLDRCGNGHTWGCVVCGARQAGEESA